MSGIGASAFGPDTETPLSAGPAGLADVYALRCWYMTTAPTITAATTMMVSTVRTEETAERRKEPVRTAVDPPEFFLPFFTVVSLAETPDTTRNTSPSGPMRGDGKVERKAEIAPVLQRGTPGCAAVQYSRTYEY